jgi:hypothetical protein
MYPIVNICLSFITTSMIVLRGKLGGGPTDQLANVLRIVSRVLFLRSNMVHPTLLG